MGHQNEENIVAKLPDKFEEWTPPWTAEEFDADRAARLVFNAEKAAEKAKDRNATLLTEKTAVETELATTKDELVAKGNASDAEKDKALVAANARIRDLETNGRPEDSALLARLRVAMDAGLTADDAERLRGTTPEELAEDAAALAERFGITKNDDADGGKPPARGVISSSALGNGRDRTADQGVLLTPEQIIAQDAKDANNGLNLAFR